MSDGNKMQCKIITPERIFFDEAVDMVELNTTEGEIGVYKNHVPMTMIIAPGVLTITKDDQKKEAALLSGFVQILEDSITILAEAVEWPDEIDAQRAEAARQRAEKRLASQDSRIDYLRAEVALKRAVCRINMLKK